MPDHYPLEPGADEMRRLIDEAARRVIAHIESLPSQPAQNVEGATEYARTLIEPLPQRGESYEALLDFLFREAIPRSFTAAGPGYLAYVPGGGIYHAAVADYIADAVNRYVGVCAAAPVLAQLEANVVRWFCEIVFRARGEKLRHEGIEDGDLLVVQLRPKGRAASGELVIGKIGEEVYVGRWWQKNGSKALMSDGPSVVTTGAAKGTLKVVAAINAIIRPEK